MSTVTYAAASSSNVSGGWVPLYILGDGLGVIKLEVVIGIRAEAGLDAGIE